MRITVIIATYNRAESLSRTLESFEVIRRGSPDSIFDILVMDNNSKDSTKSIVAEFQNSRRLDISYALEPRQGKVFALNAGLKMAQGDVIAFTDDDVVVDSQWIERIVYNFTFDQPDAITGRIFGHCDGVFPRWYSNKLSCVLVEINDYPKRSMTHFLTGANMAVRKNALMKIQGFDIHSDLINEDTILSKKLEKQGFRMIYDPELVVHHYFDPKRMNKPYFRRWYRLSGKANAEINREQDEQFTRKLLRIPYWRYAQFLKYIRGIIANIFDEPERFYYELQFIRFLGFLSQRWRRGNRIPLFSKKSHDYRGE